MANSIPKPTHQIHSDDEPLPASGSPFDYSADNNMNYPADQDPAAQQKTSPFYVPGNRDLRPQQGAEYATDTLGGEGRFDERPGFKDDSAASMPHAKPGIADKIIGKTEQLAGKVIRDPELETKGSVRSEVGK